jgi:hypothetical protein
MSKAVDPIPKPLYMGFQSPPGFEPWKLSGLVYAPLLDCSIEVKWPSNRHQRGFQESISILFNDSSQEWHELKTFYLEKLEERF